MQPVSEMYLDEHLVHVLATGDGVHVALQVHGEELEHEVQLVLLHQNILQTETEHLNVTHCLIMNMNISRQLQ